MARHNYQSFAEKIEINKSWHWRWGNWLSKGYPYLEARAWTPQVIGNKLCFSVQLENNKWQIVWGDAAGKAYDDVYDLGILKTKPIYIASENNQWFLVLDQQESQRYSYQISYKIENDQVLIYRFPLGRSNPSGKQPQWR